MNYSPLDKHYSIRLQIIKMLKTIEKAENYLVYTILFLLPLAFVSLFANPFTTTKIVVLAGGALMLVFVKIIKTFVSGQIKFNVGNFDFPVILLMVAYFASAWLNTPNRLEAFFLPGPASIVLASGVLYFVINQQSEASRKTIPLVLYLSGLVSALITLLSASGIFSNLQALPAYMRVEGFTPLGGVLPNILFFVILMPFGFKFIVSEKQITKKVFWGVSLALVVFGLIINIFMALPGKTTAVRLPDLNTSWTIAIDTLKVSPLLGSGAGNYLTAFNQFRPLEYNQTDLWSVRFNTARNFYFTALTETGLVGLAALVLLIVSASKLFKVSEALQNTNTTALFLSLVLLALFPANIVILAILLVLFALNANRQTIDLGAITKPYGTEASEQFAAKLPVLIVTLPVLTLIGYISFMGSRVVYAEHIYRNGLMAVAQNDGQKAYDTLQDAINKAPLSDRYHVSYAQLNLALANSIASAQDITDQDRATITQLIQQAIREAKNAVALNPQRSGNWEVLARTYQTVIPLAENADAFAAESYRQAIAYDPINPNLRIALGGIHYGAGDFENAVQIFNLAASAKPDLPNAYYNLAFALKEMNEIDAAIQQMAIVLSLVDRDSEDYKLASQALEELESKQAELSAENADGENLNAPQQQEQVLNPPIELNQEDQPPAPEPTATPSPTPTPLP